MDTLTRVAKASLTATALALLMTMHLASTPPDSTLGNYHMNGMSLCASSRAPIGAEYGGEAIRYHCVALPLGY